MPEADVDLSLSQYLEVLLRRRKIVISCAAMVFLLACFYAFNTRPVYRAKALLNIEQLTRGVATESQQAEDDPDAYFETQHKLIKSDAMTQAVYDEMGLDKTLDFSNPQGLAKLQKAITVTPLPRTRLVYIEVDSREAPLAAEIANKLAQRFVEQNLKNQLFMSRDVLEALQMKKDAPNAQQIYQSLPAVVNNKLIQSIKEQKVSLDAQIADMQMRYTASHPSVLALKNRQLALDTTLNQEVDNIIRSLKTQLSGELQGNNVRIVDMARVPVKPEKPNKPAALVLGFVGGLVLGFFAALLIELLDQSIRNEHDVQRKLGQTLLEVIPHYRCKSGEKVYGALLSPEPSITSEAIRNLRTMIDFALATQTAGSFMVTSSLQEEGKSFISSNIAVAFAQLGSKVLLIDGDMRRPKQHKNFGLSTEKGLSDYLKGGGEAEDVLRLLQTTDVPNLSVLTCGPRPPNPSELLNTARLAALVSWAQKHFFRVIVDCTPMFPISDALLWGRHIRSSLVVTWFGRTRAPMVRTACAKLASGGVKNLGIVINGARSGGLSYAADSRYTRYYGGYIETEQGSVLKKKKA